MGNIAILLGVAVLVIVVASTLLWLVLRPRDPSMEDTMRTFTQGRRAMQPRRRAPRPGAAPPANSHRLPPPKR